MATHTQPCCECFFLLLCLYDGFQLLCLLPNSDGIGSQWLSLSGLMFQNCLFLKKTHVDQILCFSRQQAVSDTLFRAQQTEEKKSFVSAARLLACSLYAVRYGGLCTHTSGGLVNDNTNKFFVTMHATLYLSPPGRFSFAIKLFLICSGVQSRSRIRPIHVPSNFRLGIENKLKEKIFILSFLLI